MRAAYFVKHLSSRYLCVYAYINGGKFCCFSLSQCTVYTIHETYTNNVEILDSAHFNLGKSRACAFGHWNVTMWDTHTPVVMIYKCVIGTKLTLWYPSVCYTFSSNNIKIIIPEFAHTQTQSHTHTVIIMGLHIDTKFFHIWLCLYLYYYRKNAFLATLTRKYEKNTCLVCNKSSSFQSN